MRYDVRMILVLSRFAVIIPSPATMITGLQLARSLQSVNLIAIPRARNRPLRSYHNKQSAHPSTQLEIRTGMRQLSGTTKMMAYQPDMTGSDHNDQNREDVKRNRTIYTIDYCAPTDPQKLQGLVQKYIDTLPQYIINRPVVYHTQIAFTELKRQLLQQNLLDPSRNNMPIKPIILDSGCGTAKSTIRLGLQYPEAIVLGIDRSLLRLTKNKLVTKQYIPQEDFRINTELRLKFESSSQQLQQDSDMENDDEVDDPTRLIEQVASNVWLIRAELIDFWRFLKQNSWNNKIQTHYMLYPNPYPKQTRLQLRWYAHPSFPLCLQLLQPDEVCTIIDIPDQSRDRMMIVRSNWKQYLDELAVSAKMILDSQQQQQKYRNKGASGSASDLHDFAELVVGDVREMTIPVTKQDMEQQALTNFELKYWTVGEPTFELAIYSKIKPERLSTRTK